jgi:hypothetical protein
MACLPALLRKVKVLLTQEQKLWRSPSETTWKVVLPSQLSQHNCAHQSVIYPSFSTVLKLTIGYIKQVFPGRCVSRSLWMMRKRSGDVLCYHWNSLMPGGLLARRPSGYTPDGVWKMERELDGISRHRPSPKGWLLGQSFTRRPAYMYALPTGKLNRALWQDYNRFYFLVSGLNAYLGRWGVG